MDRPVKEYYVVRSRRAKIWNIRPARRERSYTQRSSSEVKITKNYILLRGIHDQN